MEYFTAHRNDYSYPWKMKKRYATAEAAVLTARHLFQICGYAVILRSDRTKIAQLKSDALDRVWVEVTVEGGKYL